MMILTLKYNYEDDDGDDDGVDGDDDGYDDYDDDDDGDDCYCSGLSCPSSSATRPSLLIRCRITWW